MADEVKQLLRVLDSLGESSQFCTSGSLTPVLPGLEVKGIGKVGMPLTAADVKRLIAQASQAPYGRGKETIVDTAVRRVWQVDPRQFSLCNPAWGPFVAGIVQAVRKEFGIGQKVEHELYKLLIYEKGSFFAPHRDSEKMPGMFATLVVGLPSRHAGGTLIVTHDGESKRIEFGGAESEYKVQYAAFYTDCQHEITPVTAGYRACLVYNLALARRKTQPSAPENSRAVDAAAALLPKLFADESRDKIAIPFKHQYTEAALEPRQLKGADRSRVAVLARAAERLGYQVFLALMTHHQSGSVDEGSLDYDPYRSRRSYYRDYEDDEDLSDDNPVAEFQEIFEESLTLDYWLDARGRKQPFGEMSLDENEIVSDIAADDRPYKQEIQEATGNEGVSMERWYRQGVVVIWPRDRYFRILAGEGQAHAIPALEKLVKARAKPDEDAACHDFAKEIIDRWVKPEHGREEGSLGTRMLKLLDRIGAADLATRFVRHVLPGDFDGTEGLILSRIGHRFGWANLADPLFDFFSRQSPGESSSPLAAPVSIFEALCCSPPALTDERRSVCSVLAGELEQLVERWDGYRGHAWYREEEARAGIVESVFRAFHGLGEQDRLNRFIPHVLAHPKRYDLYKDLIPAVKTLHRFFRGDSPRQESLDRLRNHCLAELRARTAQPIEPPADWSRDAKVKCACADCRELVRFMRDAAERVHRFPRRNEIRQHLHRQIDEHELDLTHVTERKGSPQTLVCTKTQASYERRLAQFRVDSRLLRELEQLAGGASRPDAPAARRRSKVKATRKG